MFAGGFTLRRGGRPGRAARAGPARRQVLGAGRNGRYRLLETLREYAAARLAEAGEAAPSATATSTTSSALAEAADPDLDRDKDAWRARVEPERDNLRAALEWGLAQEDPTRGRRLAADVAWLWNLRGRGPRAWRT